MRTRRPRPQDEDGFTLIEVVAAIVVLGVLASAVVVVLAQSLEASRTSRQRVAAANVIAAQMDRIRNAGAAALAVGVTNPTPVDVDGTTYSLTQTVRWVSGPNNDTDSCAGTGTALFKSVSITAVWPDMVATKPVRSDTVLTPEVGDVDPTAITIPVRVRDRENLPREGVAVTLLGTPSTATAGVSLSQLTDNYGCVVFANVKAGNYTASTESSSTPPDVDWQGVDHSVAVGSSTAGSWLATTEFQWDRSANLTLTPSAPDASHPVVPGIGATVAHTSLTTPGTKAFPATSTATSVTAANLFPFSDGYQSWAGACTDSDPQAWTGGARTGRTILSPGGTGIATVATRGVDVTAETRRRPTATLTVTAVHAADSGCPSGMDVSLGTVTNGGTVSVALPYGSWTFYATTGTRTGSSVQSITPGTGAIGVTVTAS